SGPDAPQPRKMRWAPFPPRAGDFHPDHPGFRPGTSRMDRVLLVARAVRDDPGRAVPRSLDPGGTGISQRSGRDGPGRRGGHGHKGDLSMLFKLFCGGASGLLSRTRLGMIPAWSQERDEPPPKKKDVFGKRKGEAGKKGDFAKKKGEPGPEGDLNRAYN